MGVKFSSGNVFVNKKKTERLFCERESLKRKISLLRKVKIKIEKKYA